MKSASRRQMRTPVGNKTKRGAEVEVTPKTPRPSETTPSKTCSLDTSVSNPEDRKQHHKSRQLQWNNIPKLYNDDTNGENAHSPYQPNPSSHAGGKEIGALSPICLNAMNGRSGCQTRCKKTGLLPSPGTLIAQPIIDHTNDINSEHRDKISGTGNEDDRRSTDTEPNASSPEISSSGRRLLFWSNPAFSTQAASVDTGIASSTSSASLQEQKMTVDQTDSEAESNYFDGQHISQDSCDRRSKGKNALRQVANPMNSDSRLRDSTATAVEQKMAVEETVFEAESNNVDGQHICLDKCDTLSKGKCALRKVADPMSSDSRLCDSAVTAVENQAPQGVSSERNVSLNENSRDTENILEPRAIYTHCPSSASSMKKPQAPKQQMIVNAGLEEIQEEIDRLTERLAELHLQKRKHEAILKQTQEDREKYAVPDYIMTANRSVARNNKQENKKGAECPAGQVNIMNGPIRNGVNARGTIIRQNSKIPQLQGVHNAGSKSNEDKSLGPPPRRVAQCSIASGSKLSEMRRSVSSSGTKIESSSNERQKSSRRLSLGGIAASESRSQNQLETQVLVKSTSFKGTPSRVVSSRYGRPITPDACRPCAPGPSQQNRSKRKDRPSVSALSPLPSITLSPSQKSCIPRSGYPSRSGLSTPTRDRQLIKPSAPSVSSSMQTLPATMSSSIFRSQERFRLFHTPRCSSHLPRLDSPKSTAALYKCLELLLEDSKHFFKTLSPVRSNVGRSPLDQEPATSPSSCFPQAQNIPVLSSVEATLPAINTCRLEFTSPRDSGCVKRISDGQSRRSFFAMESS